MFILWYTPANLAEPQNFVVIFPNGVFPSRMKLCKDLGPTAAGSSWFVTLFIELVSKAKTDT